MRTDPRRSPRSPAGRRAAWVAVLLAVAGAGCRDAAPLRIGVVMNAFGEEGARAAAEDINAAGGIDGRPLELVIVPGESTATGAAIEAAERFAGDPSILAVVGHRNSTSSLSASQVYNARGLVHIAPTSTAPMLKVAGPYTFRLVPEDAKQAAFMAEAAVGLARMTTAAVFYENDDYGRGLHGALVGELEARGVRVVASIPFMRSAGLETTELVPVNLARHRPDAVFWIGGEHRLRAFMAAVHAALPSVLVLASEAVDHEAFYTDPVHFRGLHFVRFVDPTASDPCVVRLRARADARHGARSEDVLTHDAVVALAEAMRAGARSRDALRDRLAAIGSTAPPVGGCAGPIRFDETGAVDRPFLLARVDSTGVHPARRSP